ncbi:collagen-binding domain-containing protein [Enterococcus canintestini]|uniref:WxL domain-containing protein n=1 Tax=Enterococcus canintestini TaxID=317010 RepID=A0A267HT65_9ENTE|nr:collagen-binding domain-containing protein [Enterococcus canintestini]PAB01536.1 hypothetical protein AKL21_03515 [Enterococcus canintestini]
MKKIISLSLILGLFLQSPFVAFASEQEQTSSTDVTATTENSATANSEIRPAAQLTATSQTDTVASTNETTASSTGTSNQATTNTETTTTSSGETTSSTEKTADLSTDFLARTKRFSENNFQSVAEIQDWLNTYDIFSIGGVQIVNYPFTGSVAIINGGLSINGASATIQDSKTANYGSIVNGPLYVGDSNTIEFKNTQDKGIYSNYQLHDQSSDNGDRPTGKGVIKGLTGKLKNFGTVLNNAGLTIPDFTAANNNQSAYLQQLGKGKGDSIVSGNIIIKRLDNHAVTGQPHTYVYNLNLNDSEQFPGSIEFSDFTKDSDTVVVNVTNDNGKINIGGGLTNNPDNIIWNFPTATKITNTTNFKGKVMAPHASVITNQILDGGTFWQFGFGDSGSLEKANITAEISKNLLLNTSIDDVAKSFVTTITNHDGQTFIRDATSETEKANFKQELEKVSVTYYDNITQKTVDSIDTSKPGDFTIEYTYYYDEKGKINYPTARTQIIISGTLELSQIPNLKFGTIKLGSNTSQLKLDGFDISDNSLPSDGTNAGVIQVTDTRINGNWKLALAVGGFNLKGDTAKESTINGSITLGLNESNSLTSTSPLLGTGTKEYKIDKDNSFLALDSDVTKAKEGTYQGQLTWTLSDVPN